MWLLQLASVILACLICGRVAERFGQSRVIGEIVAGVILGPTVFGQLVPSLYDLVFGQTASSGMSQMGEVGLILLMFHIGLHTHRSGAQPGEAARIPAVVALLGFAAPFALGFGIALFSRAALAPQAPPLPYALFCGVALAISAVPVMARIVADRGLQARPSATIALTAAVITDVIGWLLFASVVLLSSAQANALSISRNFIWLVAYIGGCWFLARFVVRPLARRAAAVRPSSGLALIVGYVLASAWATSSIGFHSVFGGFLPGLLLRDVAEFREHWDRQLNGFVEIVLLPLFFSYTGLYLSIAAVDDCASWIWFSVFLAGGFIGKFGGSYLGARIAGLKPADSAVVGALMNTRGLVELVVLSVGLQLNILPARVYTILVIFALTTTVMTSPLVRFLIERQTSGASAVSLGRV